MRSAAFLLLVAAVGCKENVILPGPTVTPPHTTTAVPNAGVPRAQPATLMFTAQPTSGIVGRALSLVEVTVLDTLGYPDPVSGLAITLTVKPFKDGVLTGTTTVRTTNGVARFTDLVISEPSPTWSLIASTPGRPWVRCFWFPVTVDQ